MSFLRFLGAAEMPAESGVRNAANRLVLCVVTMRGCSFARGRA